MRRLALMLLATAALAVPSKPRIVHLADGSRYIGRVVESECSDELLVMTHIRSGAKRSIPWADVRKDIARSMRVELGFEVEEGENDAMLMDGVRIINKAGTEFSGMLKNADTWKKDGACTLKTAEGDRRIRVSDIREGPTDVRIDKREVYTNEEYYAIEYAANPPKTAEDHFQLAERCRIFGALERAKEHYEKCIALKDPKYTESKLKRLLDKINKRLASSEADGELKEIKKAIVFKKFKRSVELIDAFKKKYEGDEDWLTEAKELEEELKTKRHDHYTTTVPRLLRDAVKDVLGRKAKKEGEEWSLRQAQQYAAAEPSAEISASRDAVDHVAEKLGIPPEEVVTFWNERPKRAAPYKAFYRDGTFIVVDNLEDALSRAPKFKGSKDGPKPPKPRKPRTPDAWWAGKIKAGKWREIRDWLYAWWAEKSNMCEVLEPKEEICSTCAGKGYTQGLHTTAQGSVPYADRCTNCHMAKFYRVVRFK